MQVSVCVCVCVCVCMRQDRNVWPGTPWVGVYPQKFKDNPLTAPTVGATLDMAWASKLSHINLGGLGGSE